MSEENKRPSRQDMSQLFHMLKGLHQMNRLMGNQKIGSATIKLDQFEKLRRNFSFHAEKYEKSSALLRNTSDRIERAKLVYSISESKQQMQNSLRQMTNVTMKLAQKHRRKKAQIKHKNEEEVKDLVEQEIQYKNLTLYNLQKCFFRLTKTERDIPAYKSIKDKQIMTLSELKRNAEAKKGLIEDQQQQNLEQKEMLEALKYIDDKIQQKLDSILDGINIMNYNAIKIHESLNIIQKKIVVNRDKIHKNMQQLKKNQKRIDEAAQHVTKPNCIVNVIIVVLIGILGYLIVRVVWFGDSEGSDIII